MDEGGATPVTCNKRTFQPSSSTIRTTLIRCIQTRSSLASRTFFQRTVATNRSLVSTSVASTKYAAFATAFRSPPAEPSVPPFVLELAPLRCPALSGFEQPATLRLVGCQLVSALFRQSGDRTSRRSQQRSPKPFCIHLKVVFPRSSRFSSPA